MKKQPNLPLSELPPHAGGFVNYERHECHFGNVKIWTHPESKASLYAGGWLRGFHPRSGWALIDLADHVSPVEIAGKNLSGSLAFARSIAAAHEFHAPVLNLPIRDYGIPRLGRIFWDTLAADVVGMLSAGRSVAVACEGGHGRTGLVLAILMARIDPTISDPQEWVWNNYCIEAIETREQINYVDEMIGG